MEANMDGNKEENVSLHFAVPPYGPSWCRRAELAARKRRIGPGPGGEGGRFPTPRRSSFCAPRFPNKISASVCPPLRVLALLQFP